ncbi:MAG: type II toxin-antitoxin system RelB/DinJ family antitoxin [Firmicutes bacterium]|nr:type II toxin-antitoxin system RelB/DinJ family antitoxin [Bacillota bacterium]
MPKNEFIRARVDENLKNNVDIIFSGLGLTMTDAITLFLKQCELRKGLPFEVRFPNEETVRVFEETDRGINLKRYAGAETLFRDLDI